MGSFYSKISPSDDVSITPGISRDIALTCILLSQIVYFYGDKFIAKADETLGEFIAKNPPMGKDSEEIRESIALLAKDPRSHGGLVIAFLSHESTCTQVGVTVNHQMQRIVVIFRGTESIKDMYIDMLGVVKKGKWQGGVKNPENPEVAVHSGFLKALLDGGDKSVFSEISKIVKSLLENHPEYDLIVTGHSLGAANAQLFGFMFSYETTHNISVISFGSPRVGNLLLIYIYIFHVLNHFLLIYICKLHWNLRM